ncbi:MAG TPA: hypothetical protein VG076_06435 [Acidimicrobiales bacterium]|nr:hypothetical protein [Acidimicrobiales bacterium]
MAAVSAMVTIDNCPICRKPVLRNDSNIVAARVRGMSSDIVSFFHVHCYPGDEGTMFEKLDEEPEGD